MGDFDELEKSAEAGLPASPDRRAELTPAGYLAEMKARFKSGKRRPAYALAKEAVARYPDDPLILSYYGYLQAIADIKYRTGIETCKKALTVLAKKAMFGEEEIYAVIYFNLGRTYLAAGMKQDAIDSFRKGTKFNIRNSDLLQELRRLGERREVPIVFLDRANPINKYLGKVLHRTGNRPRGVSRGQGPR